MPYPYDLGYPPPEAPLNLYATPQSIVAGDTLSFRKRLALYPPSQGWSLAYSLRGVPGAIIDFAAGVDGEDFLFSIPAATTALWPPGRYSARGFVSKAGERHQVDEGWIVVESNLSTVSPDLDLRTHAKRVLDAIELTIEGRAGDDILDSQIDNTSFRRLTPDQLLLLRDRYRLEVQTEEAKARVKAGFASGRNIFTRFSQPM